MSVMTMDGFFRPVQSSTGPATYLPKVVTSTATCEGAVPTQTSGPPPPVDSSSDIPISTKYLDFLANPNGYHGSDLIDDGRSNSSASGHNIAGVARGTANSEWGGSRPGKLLMQATGEGVSPDYNSYYRFLALRGPLMIHGWGYDINGKPIPNSEEGVDSPQFKSTYDGLSDKFSQNWLQDPDTWPVAPVDLRFDRKRGVWTVPSAFRLYQIEVDESEGIAAGAAGTAKVLKHKDDILNADGTAVTDPEIEVENWTAATIPNESKALAYYDTAECKYWLVVGSGGGGGDTTVKVGSVGCSNDISCSLLGSDCLLFG